jgi:pimeloyl-ACP methyl ester carboxylesterase
MRAYAGFVGAVLGKLGLSEVDVLGMSWGGITAQQLAHDHPAVVRRLVLASTTPGFLSVPSRPSSTAALLSPSRQAERMDEVVKKIYGGDFLRDPDLIDKLKLVRPVHEATYRRQLVAILGWTSVPWLRTIQKETLILHGDDDPVVQVVNSRMMNWLMPNAHRILVPNGGHLYLFTRAEEYAHVVGDFLSEDLDALRDNPRWGGVGREGAARGG